MPAIHSRACIERGCVFSCCGWFCAHWPGCR